ncbi:acyltransferase family protein [Paraurantiacibacter namhicola]|uniref:Acyltransferase family protein n=1 Tax=Paraurantiacibacter namhicola TaxID=645517 RepID=A0A1C7D6V1_9SPHN|nr:acyltransferase [Paraurantiacibacter namhicola]ANU07190.1 Acyltransferase family protein [Paraurantiacibacter namhicola]
MPTHRSERIQSIQLMRVLLAFMVAGYHYAYAFAANIGEGLSLPPTDYQFGSAGMVSFFFMSGYIITFASRRDFEDPHGSRNFLIRRFTRILPTWWVSLFVLAFALIFLAGQSVDPINFLRSLALLPSWTIGNEAFPQPLNYPGWTLFIEMVFYLGFGLAIMFGKRIAYAAIAIGALVAVTLGTMLQPEGAIAYMLTTPVYVMFPLGIALASWRLGGGAMKLWQRIAIFGVAAAIFMTAPFPSTGIDLGWEYLWWAGVPGMLACTAILGGPMQVPFFDLVDRMGDAVYALYLFHIPLAWIWTWGFPKLVVGQPELFFVSLFSASVVFSWYYYHWLELPLIKQVNRRLKASAQNDRMLQRTGY